MNKQDLKSLLENIYHLLENDPTGGNGTLSLPPKELDKDPKLQPQLLNYDATIIAPKLPECPWIDPWWGVWPNGVSVIWPPPVGIPYPPMGTGGTWIDFAPQYHGGPVPPIHYTMYIYPPSVPDGIISSWVWNVTGSHQWPNFWGQFPDGPPT